MVEPDFFIDRPPTALFQPDSPTHNKSTFLEEKVVFDFNLDVEPILQCLVGKTLEQSLIEVKEQYELEVLREHKRKFKTLRETELLQT